MKPTAPPYGAAPSARCRALYRAGRALRPLLALALLCLHGGCFGGDRGGPVVGGETNWLVSCSVDADCGELACLCGLCTAPCQEKCDQFGEAALCVSDADRAHTLLCASEPAAAADMCLLTCDYEHDCPGRDACEQGVCLPEPGHPGPCVTETDTDLDGEADLRTTHAYDGRGNLRTQERDLDADGSGETVNTYSYDARGRRDELLARDASGALLGRTVWSYEPDRLIVRDFDPRGQVTTIRTILMGADGDPVELLAADADGTLQSRHTYVHDPDGMRTVTEIDSNGDGVVDSYYTASGDAQGRLSTASADADADGVADRRMTLTYDAEGNRLRMDVDDGADGTVDTRETYTYDCWP